ncbi:MAG TPA: LamG domain-containing protein [Flavobacterium sp.]|uniref:LamG domain-containing protein n=1 Tax=Flavobacterium sp. TaxID=239 RepID=UPI002DBC4957|nr:LamG domain-containing protein [Flavobacterium sp.]HEU4791114.1 LamG domain-containing protein [Flavobacterium sp.]
MKKVLLFTVVFVFTFLANAQTPIQEFNFDGTLGNINNDISFSGDIKFVSDRTGTANSAIRVTNSVIEMTALNLPVANSSRTVSIWVKYNDIAIVNYIWGYGSYYNAGYFGLLQQGAITSKSDLNLAGSGVANDVMVTTTIAQNTWYNYVVTYDGLTSKIYRNGKLIKASISPKKMTSGLVFAIGRMGTSVSINADIDDLKIYDVVLSGDEVVRLYNNTSILAPNDFAVVNASKKVGQIAVEESVKTSNAVSVKPELVLYNPVETKVIKSSEIYSEQGEKVFSGNKNQIDITTLPEGTYLLKVTNSTQNSNTQKLTVK